jgi:hypothetical protein
LQKEVEFKFDEEAVVVKVGDLGIGPWGGGGSCVFICVGMTLKCRGWWDPRFLADVDHQARECDAIDVTFLERGDNPRGIAMLTSRRDRTTRL